MIVCSCTGLSERRIREEVRGGSRDVRALARSCGAGADCGQCACELRRIVADETRPAALPHRVLAR